ncbi:hypothetical protein PILCRDRAFT_163 [Piloderma croceum F 1598]|uniref:Uncharacterized protein n=1 Tax=Piloderma croceum (strain F 1598) TaxID=765440 RepID=A0A0C3BBA2_PILCF|nr:hypothetical protein PILCRDRAFT_6992 [Piloderma croceum F 1598]KIM92018.1 hypothetical protein PILCRDRAFT_163 [Piloderma croceum F 1598]
MPSASIHYHTLRLWRSLEHQLGAYAQRSALTSWPNDTSSNDTSPYNALPSPQSKSALSLEQWWNLEVGLRVVLGSDSEQSVLEYCEHHRGEPLPTAESNANQDETRKRTTDINEWDQKFITVDQEMLFEIILAANYLDICFFSFFDLLFTAHTHRLIVRSDVGCKLFNIVNDFTPEEEVPYPFISVPSPILIDLARLKAQIKRENEWAEDRDAVELRVYFAKMSLNRF